ncbi:hypothetical protein D3C73_1357490 [compost metagenome]
MIVWRVKKNNPLLPHIREQIEILSRQESCRRLAPVERAAGKGNSTKRSIRLLLLVACPMQAVEMTDNLEQGRILLQLRTALPV